MTLIQFDDGSGRRIGSAVRFVEELAGKRKPLLFDRVDSSGGGKVFRICTFTGSWDIDTMKTVTFRNVTTTPNTLSATNLFFDIPDDGTKNCAVGKDGTAWYLIQWQWAIATCTTAAT
jgi:hypothetical protein